MRSVSPLFITIIKPTKITLTEEKELNITKTSLFIHLVESSNIGNLVSIPSLDIKPLQSF